jgi:hypothetical protein
VNDQLTQRTENEKGCCCGTWEQSKQKPFMLVPDLHAADKAVSKQNASLSTDI